MWIHLPVELWDMIFDHIAESDLATLNNVCTSLHRLTEPRLYRVIRWTNGKPSEVSQRSPRIHLLLHSILNRPELALYITEARFTSYIENVRSREPKAIPSLWRHGSNSGFTKIESGKVESLIERARLSPKNEWLEEFNRGAGDVIIAILLSQLSKLESLHIEVGFQEEDRPFIGSMLRQALTSSTSSTGLPHFETLKMVDISIDRANNSFHAVVIDFDQQVAPLFDLPAIETLSLSWLAPETTPLWPGMRPVATTLTTLIVKRSRINENILGQLLAATPNLKNLVCELAYEYKFRPNEFCDCAKLRSALDQIKTTIESLTVQLRFWTSSDNLTWETRWDLVGSLGSMEEYVKLK